MARTVHKDRLPAPSASPALRTTAHIAGATSPRPEVATSTEARSLAHRMSLRAGLELVIAAGCVAGLIGWASSGHAVAVPVAVVATISVQAAIIDAQTMRIPNQLALAAVAAVVVGAPFVAVVDQRPFGDVAAGIAVGWILGGAPILFALWLIRPASVGGGDWKLLTGQSAAIGLLAPYAAPLVLLAGGLGGLVQRVIGRRGRALPLGPGLAVGYLAAVAATVAFPEVLGGPYT